MPTISHREVYKSGDSHVITLPPDYVKWLEEEYDTKKVKLVVNGEDIEISPIKD